MDNLTHALVGAAISKAGAERATPLATATLVLAANAPDIDVLSYARGEFFALSFRRGITHGWPALVVLPLVVAAVMLAWDRWIRLRRDRTLVPARAGPTVVLSYLGVLTHPTLDWMNTYGMRWALPMDASWSYGDALFIVDPWIWLALGGAVIAVSRPGRLGTLAWGLLGMVATTLVVLVLGRAAQLVWLGGLVAVVALARTARSRPPDARPARLALAVVCAYIGVLLAADALARVEVVADARARGLQVRDVMVAPLPGNPFASEVEVLTADAYVPGTHRWLGTSRVALDPARSVPLLAGPPGMRSNALQAAAEAARTDRRVRDYLVWSRYPYVRVEARGTGWMVRVSDARYDGRAGAGGLSGLTVELGPDLRPR